MVGSPTSTRTGCLTLSGSVCEADACVTSQFS